MSEIVKGVLAGGLALVTGWILPVALNLLLIGVFVVPSLSLHVGMVGDVNRLSGAAKAAVLLGAAVVGGLVLTRCRRRCIGCSKATWDGHNGRSRSGSSGTRSSRRGSPRGWI